MRRLMGWGAAVVVVATVAVAGKASDKAPAAVPVVEILARFPLSGSPDKPGFVDVRWASKDSVYLADGLGGVTEVRLADGLPAVRKVAPPPKEMGFYEIRRIAISDRWIVVANVAQVAWKRIDQSDYGDGWKVARLRGHFHDFDIEGDEVVLLGWPPGKGYEGLERGGIVWHADLSNGLDQWHSLYESEEVARDLEIIRNGFSLGSIRYLPRGGWVVAPGFLPGVLRLSASGALISGWTAAELWGEQKAWTEGQRDVGKPSRFLAANRSVEVVLGLPEGPAVVVRVPASGKARYRLARLGAEIQWYDVPVHGVGDLAVLRGDADEKGRVVLAGVNRTGSSKTSVQDSELVVFRVP